MLAAIRSVPEIFRMSLFSNCQLENLRSLVCRRDMLKVGPLALSASVMPGLLTNTSDAAFAPSPTARAKSVIFLWMAGGVTHLDSLDPKPDAPQQIRGTLSAIPTALPGIQFSEVCPNLARIASDLCTVRSFSHDSDDHLLSQVYTLSGRKVTQAQLFTEPNLGAIVQYLLGPRNGFPGYIAVPGITRPGPPPHNLFVGGWLGNQHAPFCVGGQPAQPDFTVGEKQQVPSPVAIEDLIPPELQFPQEVTIGRLHRRSQLRSSLERSLRGLEQSGALPAMEGQFSGALKLLSSPHVRDAFDISRESDSTREEYGRTKIGGRCLLAPPGRSGSSVCSC